MSPIIDKMALGESERVYGYKCMNSPKMCKHRVAAEEAKVVNKSVKCGHEDGKAE